MVLDDRLASDQVLILDGATGTEVSRLGGAMDPVAWCGVANKSHPEIVRQVHAEYLRAGADVITSNTFSTCRHVLAGVGLADEAAHLNRKAVELAKEAIDEVEPDRPVVVAGSMSTMVAWLSGTFSPDPKFLPTREEEAANYREMADALAEGGADVILLEMMSDIPRASLAVEAAVATGLPVWIGMSASLQPDGRLSPYDMRIEERDERLHSSHRHREVRPLESLIDAMAAFEPQVMGIMHSQVATTQPALDLLRERWSGPLLAYPEATSHHFVEPDDFAEHCRSFVENGVKIVGGCCGTTIEHIRAMVDAVPERLNRMPAGEES